MNQTKDNVPGWGEADKKLQGIHVAVSAQPALFLVEDEWLNQGLIQGLIGGTGFIVLLVS